jgi:hypothetical protein
MFTDNEKVIGVIDVNSGGIMITDVVWKSALPLTSDQSVALDLDLPQGKVPVIAVMRGGKRLLILDLDGMWKNTTLAENVTVENPVPEDKEETPE